MIGEIEMTPAPGVISIIPSALSSSEDATGQRLPGEICVGQLRYKTSVGHFVTSEISTPTPERPPACNAGKRTTHLPLGKLPCQCSAVMVTPGNLESATQLLLM